jgi:hypothetical protein
VGSRCAIISGEYDWALQISRREPEVGHRINERGVRLTAANPGCDLGRFTNSTVEQPNPVRGRSPAHSTHRERPAYVSRHADRRHACAGNTSLLRAESSTSAGNVDVDGIELR